LVDNETFHDLLMGLNEKLERIAVALEQIVLNMEKPVLTRRDHEEYLETLG